VRWASWGKGREDVNIESGNEAKELEEVRKYKANKLTLLFHIHKK
jgi:hypothetical protein